MGIGLPFVKEIDKNYSDNIIMEPSGQKYKAHICPFNQRPCTAQECPMWDEIFNRCGMLDVGNVTMTKFK
jgi:hypothetical protein